MQQIFPAKFARRLSQIAALACVALLAGCGGGGGSETGGTNTSTGATTVNNVQPIVVDAGPPAAGGAINEPFVTITVCAPNNASNCQTIDHVLVDTGSWGLRLISEALTPALAAALPQATDSGGNAIVECTPFADGYSWGPIKSANLQIAGETANSLPIQVIGDSNFNNIVPNSCSGTGQTAENTVATFGANGVIGVGTFAQDCGSACAQSANTNLYYSCTSSSCKEIALAVAQQVQNPVTYFASDNNGVLITLPAVAASGAINVDGSLIFGVGTQSDNGLGSAGIYTIDDSTGYFTTNYKGISYPDSFIDSGSNGLFFNDNTIQQCNSNDAAGFYCPATTLNLSASIQGLNKNSSTVSFSVGSAATIGASVTAYPLLAGTNGDASSFDWGLPFFFGRNVYSVIEGRSAGGSAGPYFAF